MITNTTDWAKNVALGQPNRVNRLGLSESTVGGTKPKEMVVC